MTNILIIPANEFEKFLCWYQLSEVTSSVLIFTKSIKIREIWEN